MSQSAMITVMVLLLVPLWVRMRKDFVSGLSYAIVVVVAATPLIRIQTPGLLPEITLHRAILMTLLFGWMMRPPAIPTRDAPLRRRIVFWIVVATISLVGTSDLSISIKRYLDYVLDIFAFYLIVATRISARTRRRHSPPQIRLPRLGHRRRVGRPREIHPGSMSWTVSFLRTRKRMMTRDVRSTCAPPNPAGNRNGDGTASRARRGSECDLSICAYGRLDHRGRHDLQLLFRSEPWTLARLRPGVFTISLSVAGALRKPIIIFALLAALTLLARPGVLGTLSGFASSTKDPDSLKGGTYRYRLELWRVAAHGVSRRPGVFYWLRPRVGRQSIPQLDVILSRQRF